MDITLRKQSQDLLRRLHVKQGNLSNLVQRREESAVNMLQSSNKDRENARSKLAKTVKDKNTNSEENLDSTEDTNTKHQFTTSLVEKNCSTTVIKPLKEVECLTPPKSSQPYKETPNSVVRHRRLIDRNLIDDDKDNADEFLRTDRSRARLNYSYSNVDDLDLNAIKSRDKVADSRDEKENENSVTYQERLQDPGNNKVFANFINDTASKPRSILNKGSQLKRGSNKVSFNSSRSSTSDESKRFVCERALLGYDWIAALLDNDPSRMDQSESFFEELRDFRRVNRDECANNYYMSGPLSLSEVKESESVAKALEKSRVKPYMLNDRLFTVPIGKSLLPEYSDDERSTQDREPTKEEPRFVRVSIPRSTLMSPYKVKPHRRRSFDATDSIALSKHCVLGYDSSRPSTMPTASSIGLRDAMTTVKNRLTTTLPEAEKIAASYPWQQHSLSLSSISNHLNGSSAFQHPDVLGMYEKSQPNVSKGDNSFYSKQESRGDESCISKSGEHNSSSRSKSTDSLLNSTYSLMYELQQMKVQRQWPTDSQRRSQPVV